MANDRHGHSSEEAELEYSDRRSLNHKHVTDCWHVTDEPATGNNLTAGEDTRRCGSFAVV